MFTKYKRQIPPKLKIEYSLDHLKYLYRILLSNQTVNEENKDLLIETLRSISELLIWGDKNDPSLFDFFLEKNMLLFFLSFAKQDESNGKNLSVQILQTLNILFENIRSDTSLYYLLSNNHVNTLIQHEFDFSQEEIVAYYITFLKTLSMKLNQHTIYFFINEHSNEFPLYSAAIKFCKSPEPMVRIAVQTITLNIFSVNDKTSEQQISKYSTTYFYNIASSLESNIIEINKTFIKLNEMILTIILNEVLDIQLAQDINLINLNHTPEKHDIKLIQQLPENSIYSSNTTIKASRLHILSEKFYDIYHLIKTKCMPMFKKLEDLLVDHLDKLHYIDDIFKCSGSQRSHLSSLLSEILINNVFVPCYLKPLSDPLSSKIDESCNYPSSVLSFNMALFLVNIALQVLSHTSNRKSSLLNDPDNVKFSNNDPGNNNPLLQELIDLLFINTNPYQIIMYCCDVRKHSNALLSNDSSSSRLSASSVEEPLTSFSNNLNMKFKSSSMLSNRSSSNTAFDILSPSESSFSYKPDASLSIISSKHTLNTAKVDENILNKIKPNDALSVNMMMNVNTLSHHSSKLNQSLTTDSQESFVTPNSNPVFNHILSQLRYEKQSSYTDTATSNREISFLDDGGKTLIILIFLTTILTEPLIYESFKSNQLISLNEIKEMDSHKLNNQSLLPLCVEKIFQILISILTFMSDPQHKFRVIVLHLIFDLLYVIFSRYLVNPEVNSKLILLNNNPTNQVSINSPSEYDLKGAIGTRSDPCNYDHSRSLSTSGKIWENLSFGITEIINVYHQVLLGVSALLEMDEEWFLDTFENELKYQIKITPEPDVSTNIIKNSKIDSIPTSNALNYATDSVHDSNNSENKYFFDYACLALNPLLLIDPLDFKRNLPPGIFDSNDTSSISVPRQDFESLSSGNEYSFDRTSDDAHKYQSDDLARICLAYSYNLILTNIDSTKESGKYLKPLVPPKSSSSSNKSHGNTVTEDRIIAHNFRRDVFAYTPISSFSRNGSLESPNTSPLSQLSIARPASESSVEPEIYMDKDVNTFLQLRQFIEHISALFHPTSFKLIEDKWNYQKCFRDFSMTCNLPLLKSVLDLSDKDIISCTLEKHMSYNFPYWFLVVSDFYFSLVIPHQKKMAHGVVYYAAPLKDIEVAHVYNEPKSLYVRTRNSLSYRNSVFANGVNRQNLIDEKSKSPIPVRTKFHLKDPFVARSSQLPREGRLILPTQNDSLAFADPQPSFKAKLIFEDTIRCQAAKNCLLKGRSRCRKIKCKILHKMLHSAQVSFLPLPSYFLHSFTAATDDSSHLTNQRTDVATTSFSSSTTLSQTYLNAFGSDELMIPLRSNSLQGERNPFIRRVCENSVMTNYPSTIPSGNASLSNSKITRSVVENIPLTHQYITSPPSSTPNLHQYPKKFVKR